VRTGWTEQRALTEYAERAMTEDDVDTFDPEVERKLHAPDARDLAWVRERVRALTALRSEHLDGCGDTLYALCFLLYLLGEAEDARLIYAAKCANMDCGATLDAGLLSMRRTLPELRAALDPARDAALLSALESVFEDPDELAELASNLRRYFGVD
jgi:hypothetical protein